MSNMESPINIDDREAVQHLNSQISLHVTGIDCAECAQKLAKAVGQMEGAEQCRVHFSTARMTLEVNPQQISLDAIESRVRSLDYGISFSPTGQPQLVKNQGLHQWARFATRLRQDMLTWIAGGLIALAFAVSLAGAPSLYSQAFYGLAIVIGGYPIARKGVGTLRINRTLDMNFLMTIAVLGAAAIGELAEGAWVVFLFSLGEALEGYTLDRARQSIRSLMSLAPAEATVLRPCLDCTGHRGWALPNGDIYTGGPCPWCGDSEHRVPVESLAVGDRILVKAGERIPMDGRVTKGHSAVDQAPITGESVPVDKGPGDEVFAGTINGSGVLEIEVTRLAADNTLSRIIRMVEEAQEQRAPIQRWIDTFARYYTPAVIVAAILVATIPPLLFGQPFLDSPGGTRGWLYRALALLVIACPCALVISTPVSIVSAISAAARNGVLIKGGAYLEAIGQVAALAFDKTGTLTEGRPVLQHIYSIGGNGHCTAAEACPNCAEVLALAAAVERRSEHPLAQAVVEGARTRGVEEMYAAAEEVFTLTGRGIRGWVNGGLVTVGSHRYFDAEYPHDPEFCQLVSQSEQAGQTTMLVYDGQRVRGYLSVADQARVSSRLAISQLKEAGIRRVVMLTGDNFSTAQAIARGLGIDEVHANLLPEDKVAAVKSLTARYQKVAMVGDGVNDAPALAAATVGIAMGGAGTAQALETADIVLMADDLGKLPWIVRLSQATRTVILQNVAFSLGVKALFLMLALPGLATLWMAVFADVGTSLFVILNGMRLLRRRA
ncbi:MAG: heavy metal translocating P-type ATPase [Anaerolineae bacterium]|nr:heavy metal translocating P-type ATPase [Anaerolineae bacterium]MDW8099820.1 heavy metal translocating P-type ATPase [Anaerolineae bacterium]